MHMHWGRKKGLYGGLAAAPNIYRGQATTFVYLEKGKRAYLDLIYANHQTKPARVRLHRIIYPRGRSTGQSNVDQVLINLIIRVKLFTNKLAI